MERIKKNFGFGCMRLPMQGEEVDTEQFSRMVDAFLEAGFNYFDTAHGYISTKSEPAIRECLTSRHPRDSYILTDKLTGSYFNQESDIRPFFQSQLEICGVDYFDFYLMHAQSADSFAKFKRCRAYETALELKAEGKIRHVGISFHDTAGVLDQILTEYPQVEVVQLQLNYVDWESNDVQSRRCYETAVRHGKRVLVMEPVKGGLLADIPEEAKALLKEAAPDASPASWAVRFAASLPSVAVVLSGMSNMEQMEDNLSYMGQFQPLTDAEQRVIQRVTEVILSKAAIACTSCRYCVDGCPRKIAIPDYFKLVNNISKFGEAQRAGAKMSYRYRTEELRMGKASDCVKCGKCEAACPQHLPIRELLVKVAEEFERQ